MKELWRTVPVCAVANGNLLDARRPIRLSEGWLIIEHILRSRVYTSQTNTPRRSYGNTLTLQPGPCTATNAGVSLLQGSGKLKFRLSNAIRRTLNNYKSQLICFQRTRMHKTKQPRRTIMGQGIIMGENVVYRCSQLFGIFKG